MRHELLRCQEGLPDVSAHFQFFSCISQHETTMPPRDTEMKGATPSMPHTSSEVAIILRCRIITLTY